jgi:TolA-binding protein
MKRSERHHLKENEFAMSVGRLRETVGERRREITFAIAAILVLLVAVVSYTMWRGYANAKSREMLAAAMAVQDAPVVPPAPPPAPGTTAPANANAPTPTPPGAFPSERARLEAALPKFLAAAEAYPSSDAGIAARYHAASTLLALGRTNEAIQRFRDVIDRGAKGLYADMARLGLADAQAQAKQYDAAIAGYREFTSRSDTQVPLDAVLMELGRTYAQAGKPAEALKIYQRIVDEFPQSAYAPLARRELDVAKAGTVSS